MLKKNDEDQYDKKERVTRRKALATVASLAGLASMPALAFGVDNENDRKENNNLPARSLSPIYMMRQGNSGQFTTFDLPAKDKARPVKPGEKVTLLNYNKPGIITRLWMTFSGWFLMNWEPETYTDPTILKKLILRIYWDGNDFPSVEAPMGDFFGIGLCEYKQYLSNFIGMSSGGFYSYFPMPFNKIRIEVENMHDRVIPYVFLNANYQEMESIPADVGRFHCLYNAGTNPGSAPLTILKAEGKGHFVGCCLSMQSLLPNYLGYLEAPEYVYIDTDDKSKPTFAGTGLEDYFNGGWYFRNGEFAGPFHGVPLKDPLRSMISMYRFHDQDAICFSKNIEMAFINPRPADQTRAFKFSSTAYWYQNEASRLLFKLPAKEKLVDWYRIRDTDHQSIP